MIIFIIIRDAIRITTNFNDLCNIRLKRVREYREIWRKKGEGRMAYHV